jgi:putative ABC transport system permease protein
VSPIDRLATQLGQARLSMALRFAFARHARDAGSMSTPLLGLVVLVTVLIASVTFGASLDDLLDDPARAGATFDLASGQGGFERVSDEAQAIILEDPDVSGLTLLGAGSVNVGEHSLDVSGFEPIEGAFDVDVLEGDRPAAADEIALGRLAADELDVGVGDDLTVESPNGRQVLRVTGLVVVPGVEGTEGIGEGGLVTADGLSRLDPESAMTASAISVDGGPVDEVAARLTDATEMAIDRPDPSASSTNYERVRSAPWIVAALLGLLLVVSLANLVIVTLNRRGRDVAILRSLGADRRWVSRLGHWHALVVGGAVVVLSALLGVAAGRVVFRWRVVDRIGASDDTVVPLVAILAGALLIVLVTDLVGQVTLRWRHRSVARHLATE